MRFHFSFRKTLGYIISAGLITVFALYCSARVGYFLLLAQILTPLFSVLLSIYARSHLSLTADISDILLSKGDTCTLNVTLKNSGFLPCPPVKAETEDNPHLPAKDKTIEISAPPRKKCNRTTILTAHFAGGSYVGIRSAIFSDWFNICSFNLVETPICFKTGVIPDVIRQEADTDLLESVSDAFSSDRNDETIDDSSYTFKGFAGYDYRPYEPGDPVKRINSKVSAKMGELMVRLDEKQAASTVNVIIYPYMEQDEALMVQSVLENALGMTLSLISLDFSVKLFYLDQQTPFYESTNMDPARLEQEETDFWNSITIHTEDEIYHLSEKVADLIFSTKPYPILPEEALSETTAPCILISADPSPETTKTGLSGQGFEQIHLNIFNCRTGEWRHV